MLEPPLESKTSGELPEIVEVPRIPEGPGLGAVVGSFVVGLLLAVVLGGTTFYFTGSLAWGAVVLELSLLFGVMGMLAALGERIWEALRLKNLPAAAFAPSLALGFALILGNISATILLGPPMQDVEFVVSADSVAERITLALAVALLAPVVEEVLFRGLLQGTLEKRLRPWLAIGVTSMVFALMHGPQGALFFFFWSLPIGWVTWRTESIRPAIVVHAVNNVVGLVGLYASSATGSSVPEDGFGTTGFGLMLVFIAAFWSIHLCRRIARASEAWERTA
jgi:membrane protease YdiL (CAAX protease family)